MPTTLRVYADSFANADFSGAPRLSQPFTLNRNTKVKAASTKFVIYNSPTFTTLGLRIYADRQGRPSELLHTFTKTFTLAQLTTLAYAHVEARFDLTNIIWLRKDVQYHLVPWVTGASFDTTHYIAWMKGYPDPSTTHSTPINSFNVSGAPFHMALIGAD